MREFFTSVVIDLSCEDFWNLRVDLDYDRFIAEADGSKVRVAVADINPPLSITNGDDE